MSTMLEQAIVDAEALKEAAIKNAEQTIVEKYAGEIKEAVDMLLEQPEDEFGTELPPELPGEEEMGFEEEPLEEPVEDEFADKLPLVTQDGEKLCLCPEEEEEITVDFDKLSGAIEKEEEKLAGEAPEGREDLALGLAEGDIDLSSLIKEVLEEDEEIELEDEETELEDIEDIELPEDFLEELTEKLKVDLEIVPHGHAGPPTEYEYDHAALLAQIKELRSEIEEKEEEEVNIRGLLESKKKKIQKYGNYIMDLKEKLESMNVSNAKLLYTNRVLSSTSLNERQKLKIVEAISKVDSIEEAKVIFETLQSTVGSSKKKNPKSLSEAVQRRSSLLTARSRSKEPKKVDPTTERWKLLAGIN